ncbi:hypothetical protein ACFL6S_32040 [Candidatus Poribacteria bacterium]
MLRQIRDAIGQSYTSGEPYLWYREMAAQMNQNILGKSDENSSKDSHVKDSLVALHIADRSAEFALYMRHPVC